MEGRASLTRRAADGDLEAVEAIRRAMAAPNAGGTPSVAELAGTDADSLAIRLLRGAIVYKGRGGGDMSTATPSPSAAVTRHEERVDALLKKAYDSPLGPVPARRPARHGLVGAWLPWKQSGSPVPGVGLRDD